MGDLIVVNGEMGTVKDISIFTTELATLDNVQIIIPNTQIWSNTIKNYSVYDTRRAEWTFGVSYGTNLAQAEQIIRDTILSDPRSRDEPTPFIQVNNLNDSSVDFLVRVWVNSADYFVYQADMKRAVKEAFDEGGIDIPFPTQTVYEYHPEAETA
jgi:small conductance mechanosensitive channel